MASPRTVTKQREGVSVGTKDKALAAKQYIESKYSKRKQEHSDRAEDWDLLVQRMNDLNLNSQEQSLIKQEILRREAKQLRQKRQQLSVFHFEPVKIIGKGAFGEVRVVRHKLSKQVYAMKRMDKAEMVKKNQIQHIKTERNVLATSENPWIVDLKYSFQDELSLYLVMEYLAGGDFMTLLIRKDILSEAEARFYIAEIVLAVESIHKMNYIHRDLKPDNMLLDNRGHIKLSDFGLSKYAELSTAPDMKYRELLDKRADFRRNRKLAFSTVGTPDYIAPEVFSRQGYSETVDWWSVGIILYEMLVGYPPFYADQPADVCQKILKWKKHFVIPPEARLSRAAKDLILKLVCDSGERLGSRGVDEIKAHPFFLGVDWETIRDGPAPFVPEILHEIDTSNFDEFEEHSAFYPPQMPKQKRKRKDVNFIGYTYNEDVENQKSGLTTALEELAAIRQSSKKFSQT